MMQTAKVIGGCNWREAEGDGGIELRGVAAPERAGPHDLIYVEKAKHAERAAASAALCVIAAEGIAMARQDDSAKGATKGGVCKGSRADLDERPSPAGSIPRRSWRRLRKSAPAPASDRLR